MPAQTRPARSAGGGGQRMLAVVGGGVLVLALAGVAWALRGSSDSTKPLAAGSPIAATSGPPAGFIGPQPVGPVASAAVTPTATTPVATPAATTPAATPTPGSSGSAVSPFVAPAAPAAPAAGSKGAPVAYHFSVKPGDTMWQITALALRKTGRSNSPATVASYLHRFYAHNSSTVGGDPNIIHPGQELVWPRGL